jgi:hypothetical protein
MAILLPRSTTLLEVEHDIHRPTTLTAA